MSDVVDLASDLVRIPSVSGDAAGMRAVQKAVSAYVSDRVPGVRIRGGGSTRPWTMLTGGRGGPITLYACHTDTVPIGDPSQWTHDPVGGTVDAQHLHGRGAVDMKGGLAAATVALCDALGEGANVGLLLTADEEIGSLGASDAASEIAALDLAGIVIPEATEMRVRCGHRGAGWLRVTAHGTAAHGSAPHRGVNAVLRLAEALPRALAALPLREDGFLGAETASVGRFEGGTATNIVPSWAFAEIDQRTIGDASSLARHWASIDGIDEVEAILELPPLRTDPAAPFVASLPADVDDEPVPYFTDGAVLQRARPDVPVVVWGPGDQAQMHAVDERIELSALEDAVRRFSMQMQPSR